MSYKIHTALTDNGIQFTCPLRCADGSTARYKTHVFGMRRRENGIEHRFIKSQAPLTNGQVKRIDRTIEERTVKRYSFDTHQPLEIHLTDLIGACNYARRLKSLRGLTLYEFICKMWADELQRFTSDPNDQLLGLNT